MITTKQIIRILERARKLLSVGWTQRAFARNARGCEVVTQSPEAVCFCMIGAVSRACVRYKPCSRGFDSAWSALQSVSPAIRKDGIVSYNDAPRRKKATVLALFDRAIEKLKTS